MRYSSNYQVQTEELLKRLQKIKHKGPAMIVTAQALQEAEKNGVRQAIKALRSPDFVQDGDRPNPADWLEEWMERSG